MKNVHNRYSDHSIIYYTDYNNSLLITINSLIPFGKILDSLHINIESYKLIYRKIFQDGIYFTDYELPDYKISMLLPVNTIITKDNEQTLVINNKILFIITDTNKYADDEKWVSLEFTGFYINYFLDYDIQFIDYCINSIDIIK